MVPVIFNLVWKMATPFFLKKISVIVGLWAELMDQNWDREVLG